MYELKVPSPSFVRTALKAGKRANFEAAILVLARGLNKDLQQEIIDSWSDLDDITHHDILVLTLGVSKKSFGRLTGITAYRVQRHVVADGVSVAYPFSEPFYSSFEQLLDVAKYVPSLQIGHSPHETIFDSHGVTDIRRVLGIAERQLPALLIVSYKQKLEYLVELSAGEMQLSPAKFISALARNLDDIPYKYRRLTNEISKVSEQRSHLWWQIEAKERSLTKLTSIGQLESVIYHINQTLIDAPDDLKDMGATLIDFLSGKDEELEVVQRYKSNIIKYALSLEGSAVARRLPKKLRKAMGRRLRNEPFLPVKDSEFSSEDYVHKRKTLESEISALEKQRSDLRNKEIALYNNRAVINVATAFASAIKATLQEFGLELESQNAGSLQWTVTADGFRRMVYSVSTGVQKAENKGVTNIVSILFLSADPTDTSRLRLGEELREIQEKLQLAKLRERFELQQRMSVRPADISQALLDVQPRIVHFSGHGTTTGALCFENRIGETHPIQPDALAVLFEQFADQVSCVVLNACYSETQANAIAQHIDYVIGMNQAIGDRAAIAFAIGFYQALGAGRTIEDAYKLGCVQIRLQGISEHLTPVLITKEATQP